MRPKTYSHLIDKIDEEQNYKLILKSQQRLKSKKQNVFTEEVNKVELSAKDDKKIQSIDTIEIYPYGATKNLVCKKEEIICNI